MAAAAAKESQIPPRGIATTPINLTRGWPAKDLLPANVISQAAQKVLAEATIANPGLLYGPDEGHEPLRTVVADWNTRFYSQDGREISKENIAITGGASQNLGCLLQVATDPVYTLRAWLLAPAYFMAFRIFQDSLPARSMRAVPEGEDGVDIAVLRKLMQQSEDDAQGRGGTDSVSTVGYRVRRRVIADTGGGGCRMSRQPEHIQSTIDMSYTVFQLFPIRHHAQCLWEGARSWSNVHETLTHS